MTNLAPMMEPLSEVCTITGEVCGTPSPELRQTLEAAGGIPKTAIAAATS